VTRPARPAASGRPADRAGHRHPANQRRHDRRTSGERLADRVTAVFGSWRFIVVQTIIVCAWIGVNLFAIAERWDPYPFILLNLVFSTQAAYAAPLILLSQNRQADTDRIQAEHDYEINQTALRYLTVLHRDAHGAGCDCVEQAGARGGPPPTAGQVNAPGRREPPASSVIGITDSAGPG
jgi:uncharacterized membrane protein